ncbi:MAG TPA: hypothetical protein VGT44_03470 [Ktedonobacteraceae bacterium]|nr:hypothetical protein [Ktedonobacteraceae bacterium]
MQGKKGASQGSARVGLVIFGPQQGGQAIATVLQARHRQVSEQRDCFA